MILNSHPSKLRLGANGDELGCSYGSGSGTRSQAAPVETSNGDNILNPRLKLIEFEKNPNEAMGITVKLEEDGRFLVNRILVGGLIYRQAMLSVGDEIIELNGHQVAGQSMDVLQRLLREASGRLTFKILTGAHSFNQPKQMAIYLKAQFDYSPGSDPLCPATPAECVGLDFRIGDILKVINKDDYYWWQAIKEGHTRAGLIPSPALQEWRLASSRVGYDAVSDGCVEPDEDEKTGSRLKRGLKGIKYKIFAKSSQTKMGKKMIGSNENMKTKKKQLMSLMQFKLDIPIYEEVVKVPAHRRKCLILIGAHGVGRRHIKNTLISIYSGRYCYPIPHTSRHPRRGEENGKHYYFVEEEEMLSDIAMNGYLEYGSFEGHLYGTKLSTIQQVIEPNPRTEDQPQIAVLDIEPQSLLLIRNGLYSPFVVFIGAPTLTNSDKAEAESSLCRLLEESDYIRDTFKHLFDLIIINNDIEESVERIDESFRFLNGNPQWVPLSWIY